MLACFCSCSFYGYGFRPELMPTTSSFCSKRGLSAVLGSAGAYGYLRYFFGKQFYPNGCLVGARPRNYELGVTVP